MCSPGGQLRLDSLRRPPFKPCKELPRCFGSHHARAKSAARLVSFSSSSPPPKVEGEEEAKEEDDTSFRWNPAQSRWERVKPSRQNAELYKMDKWEEGGVSTIKTKSGTAYLVWPVIHAYLTKKKVKSISTEEAYRLQQEGAVMVDPRVVWDFEKDRVDGAVSVPLFRGVAGKSAWDTAKRIVMAVGFAMRATERDPDFKKTAEERLPKDKKLIVYCDLGGQIEVGASLEPRQNGKSFKEDPERMFGRESRSLKAIYELLQLGYTDVVHLKGGLSQWKYDGLPIATN